MSNLTYDVFVSDPPPQNGILPNGEPKRFSPVASTLIYRIIYGVRERPGEDVGAITVNAWL